MKLFIGHQGYLHDSTVLNRLWSGAAKQRVLLDWDRLLDQPIEELSARGRLAPIEPEGELVEVIVQMLVADGALVVSLCGMRHQIGQRRRVTFSL